jgi:hypothetical protein
MLTESEEAMNKRILFVAVLSLVMLAGFATQALAANSDSLVVSATVNSKITVDAGTDIVFGTFAPDDPNPAAVNHSVNVRSNVDYTLSRSESGTLWTTNMLSITGDAMGAGTKAPSAAGHDWSQVFALDLTPSAPGAAGDWMDPATYTATITYTAVP